MPATQRDGEVRWVLPKEWPLGCAEEACQWADSPEGKLFLAHHKAEMEADEDDPVIRLLLHQALICEYRLDLECVLRAYPDATFENNAEVRSYKNKINIHTAQAVQLSRSLMRLVS